MTTLAAWVSVDSRRASACYLISDSRISWPQGTSWDSGQKLFASSRFPDIFGYCGDVQFPTLALRQVVERADRGLLFPDGTPSSDRNRMIVESLTTASHGYPAHPAENSTIVHFSRGDEAGNPGFRLWRIDWSRSHPPTSIELELPTASVLALTLGTGSKTLIDRNEEWKAAQGRTARGIFSSFCEAIASGEDPRSGGPPQLVGLYPRWNGLMFGILAGGRRFLAGAEIPDGAEVHAFEWRNELFERVDPGSLRRLNDAQIQPRPQTRPKV